MSFNSQWQLAGEVEALLIGLGFLSGVVLTMTAHAWIYGHAGPSPVSAEAQTHLADALSRVVLDVEKLEAKGADIDKLKTHVTELQDRVGKLEWKA